MPLEVVAEGEQQRDLRVHARELKGKPTHKPDVEAQK